MSDRIIDSHAILQAVSAAMHDQPVTEVHTHLYPLGFGTPVPNATGATDPTGLMLWGIDELVTYHYLVAETYRMVPATELPYDRFWAMTKREQADHIWRELFVKRTPISEPARGVVTTLTRLGLDPNVPDLDDLRKWFDEQEPNSYIDLVMEIANVDLITMTNAVFDDNERERWLANPGLAADPRFRAVLRIDPLICDWPTAAGRLSEWGYACTAAMDGGSVEAARRFLRDWIDRMGALYIAASLPPDFRFPASTTDPTALAGQRVIEEVVVPVCMERGIPFAMMIGSRRGVNPALKDAGDMAGKADALSVARIAEAFPQCRFLVTMLSREDQYELCVAARKFGNLMIFGCWWFLNSPSLVEELTRMRIELLGTTFIPQHSDARVLDQMIYKWDHSREIIQRVLGEKYCDLARAGWAVTGESIRRDVALLLRNNYRSEIRA